MRGVWIEGESSKADWAAQWRAVSAISIIIGPMLLIAFIIFADTHGVRQQTAPVFGGDKHAGRAVHDDMIGRPNCCVCRLARGLLPVKRLGGFAGCEQRERIACGNGTRIAGGDGMVCGARFADCPAYRFEKLLLIV